MFSLTYFKQVQELGISSHLQILALKEIWKSSIHSLILHTQSPKSMSFIVTVLIHLCVWRKALLICSLIPSDNFYIYIVLLIGMERHDVIDQTKKNLLLLSTVYLYTPVETFLQCLAFFHLNFFLQALLAGPDVWSWFFCSILLCNNFDGCISSRKCMHCSQIVT